MEGQLIVFFVMAVAAAEAAVGLAIILMVFRTKETVNADELNLMRGEPTKSLWNTHTPQRKQLYTLFPTFAGLSSFPSSASSSISSLRPSSGEERSTWLPREWFWLHLLLPGWHSRNLVRSLLAVP